MIGVSEGRVGLLCRAVVLVVVAVPRSRCCCCECVKKGFLGGDYVISANLWGYLLNRERRFWDSLKS